MVNEYILGIDNMNKLSSTEYLTRLNSFNVFLEGSYGLSISNLVNRIKNGSTDPYTILSKYSNYLINCKLSPTTIKQRISTIRNFFEYQDIEISPRKFKIKIRLPKVVRTNKEAISKEDVADILNQCSEIRLKTYITLLASTGMRASEALSVRVKDIDFESNPARISIRGQYTKTKTDRTIFLTEEAKHQLDTWLKFKYRTRRNCHLDLEKRKSITKYVTPEKSSNDLVFLLSKKQIPNLKAMYSDLRDSFSKTLDRMGKGEREDGNERRRQITLHSFRRFVKTTISDLGYSDYSEWFIGHSGSHIGERRNQKRQKYSKRLSLT